MNYARLASAGFVRSGVGQETTSINAGAASRSALSSSRTPGGRVSPRVAERVLSFIKALDSAFKTLESCDEKLLHHPQFMPMLFRWLRHRKGGVTAARVSHGLGPGGAGRR